MDEFDVCLRADGSRPHAELVEGGHRRLLQDLSDGGFLTERPADLERDAGSTVGDRLSHFFATLDLRWMSADTHIRVRVGYRATCTDCSVQLRWCCSWPLV